MERGKFRRTPKSLSSSQIIVRFVVAGVALFFLVFIALLVNHWYLIKHAKAPAKIVSSQQTQPQPHPKHPGEPSPATGVSPVEEKPETSFTFYDSLVHKKPADLASPAAPAEPQSGFSPETKPAQEAKGGYTVQVGSFQRLDSAEGIVESLKKKGYSPSLGTVSLPNGKTWHRVRIGNCGSREEAEALVQKIKEGGDFEPMIISPEKAPATANNIPGASTAQSPALLLQGSHAGAAPKP